MISFEDARRIILEQARPLGKVRRALDKLPGMVLAESVTAPFDLPRFDNSAVDGYGVKVSDAQGISVENPAELQLIDTIQAGDSGRVNLTSGQAVRIFTGAPVPADVDAVVMQEETQTVGNAVRIFKAAKPGDNIRRRGEEFQKGREVILAGMAITPPVIGLLANLGYSSAMAYRKPRVALISTGNELVKPGKPLKPGQIYDSNTVALTAALKTIGIESIRVYQAKDTQRATKSAFEKALAENDVVISLGGISVGAFDFVKDVAEELGIETLFWRIAIKPGKPVYFGKSGKKLVFGLPGNPVSALVTYHQLVQPALLQVLGIPQQASAPQQAILLEALRKKPGRREFVRGFAAYDAAGALTVKPSVGQDSHMLGGLAKANCLIDFSLDAERLNVNEPVSIEWLRWMSDVF